MNRLEHTIITTAVLTIIIFVIAAAVLLYRMSHERPINIGQPYSLTVETVTPELMATCQGDPDCMDVVSVYERLLEQCKEC